MANDRLGSQIGLSRKATILKYNNDGTVSIGLNEGGLAQVRNEFIVPIPMAWTGQEGEFLGGYPRVGSSVVASQGHGGQWFIISYIPSNSVFDNTSSFASSSVGQNRLSALKPGRILAQVKDGTRLFIDPAVGIQAGQSDNFLHLEPHLNVISHNFLSELSFTNATRNIDATIKRDLFNNSNRNIINSTLDSVAYDKGLYTIGLDPTITSSPITSGLNIRNPALVENRQIVYEFSQSDTFDADQSEVNKYSGQASPISVSSFVSRRDMRTDALSLSLAYPNHLIETIQGTAVDIFGNIVDINRAPLPIGKINALSLKQNTDKSIVFGNIRAELRKSIAYHFEINARKGDGYSTVLPPPDVNVNSDYGRTRSRYFHDIDKEGQFKLNIPASSEIGNIPLLTRQENFSVLLAAADSSKDPNAFLKGTDNIDIYPENFAGKSSIKLSATDSVLDGYSAPSDRITGNPITYGTAFHDITNTISEFQVSANYIKAGNSLVSFDKDNRLNTNWTPLKQVVSNTIIVAGANANAGGRSGLINLDGFVNVNIGANTVDRQSIWLDMAGGMVSNFGRDLGNISWAGSFDGDIYWQIGGPGIGNQYDSRFSKQNDAYRSGTLDIRVLCSNQQHIFRIGPEGISLISSGTLTLSSQQDIIIKSNSNLLLEAENIVMHAGTTKRIVNKIGDSI
jgi:hypothetical protein